MLPLFPSTASRPVAYAISDALLVGLSWVAVYSWRFGQWPQFTRGPIGLIAAWLLIQYLLGTYTALARYQLDLGRQIRNCFAASLIVLALAAAITLLRGEAWVSTMSRSFLLPVIGLGFVSNQLLRLSQLSAHLWQPQQNWLLFVSPAERSVLSQAIEAGGCAIPCGIEWRSSSGLATLPTQLPDLLGLDGVLVGGDHQPSSEDRATLLAWQEAGVRLLSVSGWAEAFLNRLPPALLPQTWAERVEVFSHARSGPGARLKRLVDLVVSTVVLAICSPLLPLFWHRFHRDLCNGRHGRPFLRLRFQGSGRFSALPQLINVWRGEMSLVGPRPLTPVVMQELESRFPGAELRQWMRPGMTGWGRVAGPPPEESDAVAWELGRDLYYLRKYSLFLDLRLLIISLLQLLLSAVARP